MPGVLSQAQDTHFPPKGQQMPAPVCSTEPCHADEHAKWLDDIKHWRAEHLIRIGYDGKRYSDPAFAWTRSSFMQPQMMVQDRYFYDPASGKYTVDRYLDDLKTRYGGIDAVLIWPTYPNMGIDNRNQHDMIRAMPGGVEGVRAMVSDFHRRGVRVLFPMMMWDQGTRDPGMPWTQAIAEIMKEIGADGVNGDTQEGVPLAFSVAAEKVGHPLVFQPEVSPSDEALAWNVMTWGQYTFTPAPTVDRFKWLEHRHMVNISDRWKRSKTDDLQFAFFNGVGWESWENVWGIWNGITPRDAEATRRVATIERAVAPFLVSDDWEPLASVEATGVYASRWKIGQESAWTVVNRNEYDVKDASIAAENGLRYFDLYHGLEVKPSGERVPFSIEAHGFGAMFFSKHEPPKQISKLMAEMRDMTAEPLSHFSSEWKTLSQKLIDIPKTAVPTKAPAGMIKIPAASFEFKVEGIEIEGSNDIGVDVQYPWEDSPRRYHRHRLQTTTFYIDKYPVTNAEFKRFVDATHYRPRDAGNFLRDWKNGEFPAGWDKKPVTWVSLEDARAFAKWAGKRLPHEWEWQLAAQGEEGHVYPWGNEWLASAVPTPDTTRTMRGPDDVDAHPAGVSAAGVMDLVGNVWQWTDEYQDEHTRAAVLRGGSYYQPQGSKWYFPQAYRNDQHGKLLLMAESYDRAATLGFRCVMDAE